MTCRCTDKPILWAVAADEYADRVLVRERTDEHGVSHFRCAACARRWLQDHPADDQGRLTLRLRWAEIHSADVARYLNAQPGLDEFLLTMDPGVEHQPLPDAPVLHGVPELREYTARYFATPDPPRATGLEVIGGTDEALVLGSVAHARDGRYVENRPAAWLIAVQDARVVRVRAFSDWAKARSLLV